MVTPLLEKIAGTYPDKPLVMRLLRDTSPHVIETIADLKHRMPYTPSNRKTVKYGKHIGQRKLFLNEIQFLTRHPAGICVYVGASPGHKTHYLSTLFPRVKFVLVDPNRFDLKIAGVGAGAGLSHRARPHPDIVSIYHHFPTKSAAWGDNADVAALGYARVLELIAFIRDGPHRIYIIENYMTNVLARILAGLGDMTFISDIRSNVEEKGFPADADIYWNMSMMFNWMRILRPTASMLKHRVPYWNDKTAAIIDMPLFAADFALSKQYGIDFAADYRSRRFRMCRAAAVFVQPWAPLSSTECRMIVLRDGLDDIVEHDMIDMEERMNYYNSINRGWIAHINPNADRKAHFCHCGDCALENLILTQYAAGDAAIVREIAAHLGGTTDRPMAKVHIINIWKSAADMAPADLAPMIDAARMYHRGAKDASIRKIAKYTPHRGDKGAAGR